MGCVEGVMGGGARWRGISRDGGWRRLGERLKGEMLLVIVLVPHEIPLEGGEAGWWGGGVRVGRVWRVACGEWRVACGVWRVACGVWRVACGVWSVECGVWSAVEE